MTDDLRARALAWIEEDPDPATRAELEALLDDEAALADRFGATIGFGTAGLRGVLGAGPNRMNRVIVLRATAGLVRYLGDEARRRGIVIGYDGRHYSRRFAEDAAEVCAAAGVRAYLFPTVCPAPLCGYAVLALDSAGGIMVTASHNPREYNGYKVYWGNGAQIVPPHDDGIAEAISQVSAPGTLHAIARTPLDQARARGLVVDVPSSVEEGYLDGVAAIPLHPGLARDLGIVYTPLHGVGDRLARLALARAGFTRVTTVPEQAEPDPEFPTVAFPNPEEPGAMDLALARAEAEDADLVLANDPDADRLAVAVRDQDGRFALLTGNEIGILLAHYLLVHDPHPAKDRLVLTTVVSSPMLRTMAAALGVRCEEVLTGFKWITNRSIAISAETGAHFVFGYEEALGYTIGTLVRDKDGISAAVAFADLAAFARATLGRTVREELDEIYRRFGLFASLQHSLVYPGLEGAAVIRDLMARLRRTPPTALGGIAIETVRDLDAPPPGFPRSNLLAFTLVDGSRITIRPSGTEPKLKLYVDVREPVAQGEPLRAARTRAATRLDALRQATLARLATLATGATGGTVTNTR